MNVRKNALFLALITCAANPVAYGFGGYIVQEPGEEPYRSGVPQFSMPSLSPEVSGSVVGILSGIAVGTLSGYLNYKGSGIGTAPVATFLGTLGLYKGYKGRHERLVQSSNAEGDRIDNNLLASKWAQRGFVPVTMLVDRAVHTFLVLKDRKVQEEKLEAEKRELRQKLEEYLQRKAEEDEQRLALEDADYYDDEDISEDADVQAA